MKTFCSKSAGFSLVEIAIVLVIVGLLLGGLLMPLATQQEVRRVGETQKTLDEINQALIGYALNQTPPHLPCPDKTGAAGAGTANDGLEDFVVATGACVAQEGNIPWATLGIANNADAWGNRVHYAVMAAFSNRLPATTFTLAPPGPGTLTVCQTPACAVTVATGLPAVILSYGRNGFGAINSAGAANLAPTSADEIQNTGAAPLPHTVFVSRPATDANAPVGEFDDVVAWLSPNVLYNRMVSASKLP